MNRDQYAKLICRDHYKGYCACEAKNRRACKAMETLAQWSEQDLYMKGIDFQEADERTLIRQGRVSANFERRQRRVRMSWTANEPDPKKELDTTIKQLVEAENPKVSKFMEARIQEMLIKKRK